MHHTGTATIRAPRSRGGDYVFGDFLVPLLLDDAAVLYREVDVVAAHDVVLTSARLSSLSRAKVAHDRAVVGGTRP